MRGIRNVARFCSTIRRGKGKLADWRGLADVGKHITNLIGLIVKALVGARAVRDLLWNIVTSSRMPISIAGKVETNHDHQADEKIHAALSDDLLDFTGEVIAVVRK